ncbi:MAG: tetratricopeptide repeat protein, partial [Phaeodactylibacter sp.]|nr:tetratricopeptide repeat protein [Phaeodactylibacter sp.]
VLLAFSLSQCSYTQKIRDGATAYKQKQFDVAIDMLKKEYDREKSRVNQGKLAYMLGESYRETNQIEKAIQWYKQAYDYAYGFEALREYAYALKQNEQYEEAMQAFKDLGIEIGSPYEYRKEITACTIALEWQKDPNKEYIVELADFNTAFADYAPALYGEDQLVFTSDRRNATGDDTYNWTGNNFSDLFLIDLSNQSVEAFDPNLNSTNNEGTAVFNKDFTEVYFTRCFSGEKFADNFCKLMMSRKTGSSWTVPVVLNFVEEETNYGHPALSEDGNILYFSANHKEGWGGYDLYYSVRTPDGWDFPRLMNRSINTPRNEQFPFIDADTLYFASDGHTGMGGLDIFRTYKLANGSWSPAQNLKTPINSGEDDFAFVIDRRQPPMGDILQTGYFTSTRRQGIGNDDIYQFTRRIPPDEPEIVETPKEYKMILNGYVLEKIYQVADNPNSKVLGRKPLNNADVDIIFRDTSYKVTVGDDGFFSLELEEQMDYYFLASKEEYLKNENRVSTKGIGKDPNMIV